MSASSSVTGTLSCVSVSRSDLPCLIGKLENCSFGCDVFVSHGFAPNSDPLLNPIERWYIFREILNVKSSWTHNWAFCAMCNQYYTRERHQYHDVLRACTVSWACWGGHFNHIKDNLAFLYCVNLQLALQHAGWVGVRLWKDGFHPSRCKFNDQSFRSAVKPCFK